MAPQSVLDLIERFDRNKAAYKSEQYNEARLRIEFLNPFFEALGWDINNKQGYAESYKDVIYEDAIKIGGATKAPDYCFRIGGTRKFFVEAKKPTRPVRPERAFYNVSGRKVVVSKIISRFCPRSEAVEALKLMPECLSVRDKRHDL